MGFISDMFSRKRNLEVRPTFQYFSVGDAVYVNHVEGREEIPPRTKGKIISCYGSGIYGVEVEGYPYGSIGLGVFDRDMVRIDA